MIQCKVIWQVYDSKVERKVWMMMMMIITIIINEIAIFWLVCRENAGGVWFNIYIWAGYLSAVGKGKLHSITFPAWNVQCSFLIVKIQEGVGYFQLNLITRTRFQWSVWKLHEDSGVILFYKLSRVLEYSLSGNFHQTTQKCFVVDVGSVRGSFQI